MIKKYIKTTPIEAVQVTPDNHEEVKAFAYPQEITFGTLGSFHLITTIEGQMCFNDFAYLIKNQTGECYVCDEKIFEKTYKEVTE